MYGSFLLSTLTIHHSPFTMTILYIHGYGSNGNATKGQLLRKMLPDHNVISPTFDYDHSSPWQIQEEIRKAVDSEGVAMIVGSSFGGYQALCATAFFHGIVWTINPVHDVEATIQCAIIGKSPAKTSNDETMNMSLLDTYRDFDKRVFHNQVRLNQSGQWPDDTPLNFALSTDDELLGDHRPLLDLFPVHNNVVWKDNCGHRFFRFEELKDYFG